MSEETRIRKRHLWRWLLGFAALLIVLFFAALAVVWLHRASLAEAYLKRYCDQRGLICAGEFTELGLNGAEIENLSVTSNGQKALTVSKVAVAYSWPSQFLPALGPVQVYAPVLQAGFDGTALDLRGLEQFLASEGGASDPIPLLIEDGRVILETPAGELTGMVNITGELPREGEALITFDPAELQSGSDRLSWTRGEAQLTIADQRVTGTADLAIDEARLGALNVQSAEFSATLTGSDEAPVIQWNGTAQSFEFGGRSLSGLQTRGEAALSELPDGGLDTALGALQKIVGEVSADAVNLGGVASERLTVSAELQRSADRISGPITFDAASISMLTGLARSASASGEVQLDPADASYLAFTGSGVVEGAGVYAPRRESWLAELRLPEPFERHGEVLRTALDAALSEFSSGADVRFERRGDAWQLTASRPTALNAASGMTVSIIPDARPNWLRIDPDGLSLSGDLVASGGGSPTIRAAVSSAEMMPDLLRVDASNLRVDPWMENGRSLGLVLAPFKLESSDARTRLETAGDVTVAGRYPGAELKPTTLSGGFQATRGGEGWRVQTTESACLDLSTLGMNSGALSLDAVAVQICPEDGRFVRSENGKSTGTLALGDVTLPFRTRDSAGELAFIDSEVRWQLDEALRTEVKAARISTPLTIGDQTLTIEGSNPWVSLTSGEGPLTFAASLGPSDFSGSLIPANVSSAGFQMSGQSSDAGFEATLRSRDVRIEDFRDDPIYMPLRADLTATLKDGRINMTGPLRLQRSGWTIADSALDLDLSELTGTAQLKGRELTFVPDGLQPHDLSDLLRAVLPNARGKMLTNADFTITNGQLAGTGSVGVEGLGFDTFRLGTIDGVTGTVQFSDILNLTTLPDQIVSIGTIDTGVRLQDGRLAFQLIGGRVMQLQGARWPFAGGELIIAPTSWQIGGQTELINITAEKIELEQLTVALGLESELKASGTVSGTFPLEIVGPDAFLRNAVLKADENGGFLAYSGDGLEAAKGYGEFTDYAVDALRGLDYKVLELGADGNIAGEITLNLKLLGGNRDVLSGQPFEFNINLTSELAQLIRNSQSSLSSSVIIDQVKGEVLRSQGVPSSDEPD